MYCVYLDWTLDVKGQSYRTYTGEKGRNLNINYALDDILWVVDNVSYELVMMLLWLGRRILLEDASGICNSPANGSAKLVCWLLNNAGLNWAGALICELFLIDPCSSKHCCSRSRVSSKAGNLCMGRADCGSIRFPMRGKPAPRTPQLFKGQVCVWSLTEGTRMHLI